MFRGAGILAIADIILSRWVLGPLLLVLWFSAFWLLKFVVMHKLKKLAAKTKGRFYNLLIDSVKAPIFLVFTGFGVWFIGGMFLPDSAEKFLSVMFHLSIILSIFIFSDRISTGGVITYGQKAGIARGAGEIISGLIRGVLIALAALFVLDILGVPITPLLASLGIGSLAVALALQDTLANFFSGLQILIDKPVEPGQFIKLDTGQGGYIEKIGWRGTWIKMLPNNMVIIPNKKLIDSIIINYARPAPELAVLVDVGVHYSSDLKHVEKVTCEVGKEIMSKIKGGVPEFEPFIRYHTFGESSINFTVILRAKEYVDNFVVKHEFIKALHERYKKENISIPFPIRTIEIDKKSLEAVKK